MPHFDDMDTEFKELRQLVARKREHFPELTLEECVHLAVDPSLSETKPSERFSWHGYGMVATASADSKGVRIHLENPATKYTLCAFGGVIVDRTVATGWPDCAQCIDAAQKKKFDDPGWMVAG